MPPGIGYGRKPLGTRRLTKAREVTAMAVPNRSQVSDLAGSLVRGRLPDGSLLGQIVRSLTRPGVPRSADPIGPARKASQAAAGSTAGGLQPLMESRKPTVKSMVKRKNPTTGPFRPKVRLNAARVQDARSRSVSQPVREGFSSSTSSGGPSRRRRRLPGPVTGPRPSAN